MVAYGFGENFNLSIKGWVDARSSLSDLRPGLSLTAQFIQHKSPSSKLMIIPRVGSANFGDGYGLSNSVVYHKEQSPKFSWYSGMGVGWGFSGFEKISFNSFERPRLPFGYLVMAHLGLGYQLSSQLRLNCELNPIYQISTLDRSQQLLLSPSIGVGYVISPETK